MSIIILTVIINLALLPLRITSMKSALKMQKLQPQMKAIQEKYKKYPMRDPRRAEMNTEISASCTRSKARIRRAAACRWSSRCRSCSRSTPCWESRIELRQAPFLWLHDLSSPDKLFILPVLIVISTLFVQKMTPNAGMDPTQQR